LFIYRRFHIIASCDNTQHVLEVEPRTLYEVVKITTRHAVFGCIAFRINTTVYADSNTLFGGSAAIDAWLRSDLDKFLKCQFEFKSTKAGSSPNKAKLSPLFFMGRFSPFVVPFA